MRRKAMSAPAPIATEFVRQRNMSRWANRVVLDRAFAEGDGAAGVCDRDRAGASVIRSHYAVKHERCWQPLQFVVVLRPRMDTSFSSRNRRMSHAVSSKPFASFPA